ncbi:MAG: pantoate--beta-alanine ligase [Ignavibacteria bacterium]|nr:pantoate--beta-alanine ligase [Ignavibacteria bacterium]
MKVISTVREMQDFSLQMRKEGKKIGFVPTMGFLHEGHLSLVRKARQACEVVVVSIFVNPTQFAPNEDFTKYPRDEEKDKKLLLNEGVDCVFIPSAEEIYPKGFQTYVEVTGVTKGLEGQSRPAHFKGVTTVVSILFNSVMPHVAVFGQKDAQQASVIMRMVEDLKMNIRIIVSPIVREKDGLALSSRNIYLSDKERKDALVLSSSLRFAGEMVSAGERNSEKIIQQMNLRFAEVDSASLDYIKIVDSKSFEEVSSLASGGVYYILIACRIGKTRLIDNLLVDVPFQEVTAP